MLFDGGVTKDMRSLSNKSWIGSFVAHYICDYDGIGYCADQKSAPLDAFPLESSDINKHHLQILQSRISFAI